MSTKFNCSLKLRQKNLFCSFTWQLHLTSHPVLLKVPDLKHLFLQSILYQKKKLQAWVPCVLIQQTHSHHCTSQGFKQKRLLWMHCFSLLPTFPCAVAKPNSGVKDACFFYFIFSPLPPFLLLLQYIIPLGVCAVSLSYRIRDPPAQRVKSLPCPTHTNKTINNSPSSGSII